MRLKYKILWIEDEKDWVDSEVEFIKEYLEIHGFFLDLTNIEKYESEDFSTFDLIVVDYNLAEGETGAKVIAKIREQELYTEILFYSSDGESFLRDQIKNLELDGIYCASKNSCREKMKGVIYTTIRKTQDINSLRGLVMAETSELDSILLDILNKISNGDKVESIKVSERFDKKLQDYRNNIENLEEIEDFNVFLQSYHNNAMFAWRTLISFSECSKNSLNKVDFSAYKSDIIEERNTLAHHPEIETDGELSIKGKTYTEKDFIDIRKKIVHYKNVLIDIRDSIV